MTPLRRRMTEDMTVRNLSPYTQRNYLFAIARFARHFDTSPANLGPEHLRAYLNHLIVQKVSSSYFNINVAALRFLYTITLERDWVLAKLPFQKRPRKLPTVLSIEEVTRFLASIPEGKMRTVLVTAYAAGLRVFEVVALRVCDIDNKRMVLRIADGKGSKERLVMLSPRLLELLRIYWKAEHPRSEWLFPGRDPDQHISIRRVQLACQIARECRRYRQAHHHAHAATQLRHPSARSRHGRLHHQAAARSPQPVDHRPLPARRHQHGLCGTEPSRPSRSGPARHLTPIGDAAGDRGGGYLPPPWCRVQKGACRMCLATRSCGSCAP